MALVCFEGTWMGPLERNRLRKEDEGLKNLAINIEEELKGLKEDLDDVQKQKIQDLIDLIHQHFAESPAPNE